MEINVGEYGYDLLCNANYDLSSASSLMVAITRPDASTLSVPATLGTIDVTTDKGVYSANHYARYTLVDGDLSVVGEYLVRLTYLDSTKKLVSVPDSFVVYE